MSRKKQRVKRRRQRVREDILDITRELVLARGVGGVTVSAIAKELELTKPALYYYFKSKDDLLFELTYETMADEVAAIEAAVADATSGEEAVEGIIRSCASHYAANLDPFRLVYMAGQVGGTVNVKPEWLERIRPFNDRMYGRAEQLISEDQTEGLVAADVEPRRAAFLAHSAVLGVLTMEGLVDVGDDPLVHEHRDLIENLVRTHTRALRP